MPTILLNVSNLPQRTRADCLPVCAHMVTNYLGLATSYNQLLNLLQTEWFGTPFRHVERLIQIGASVSIDHLALDNIVGYLEKGLPVIACVHTADLSYWSQAVDHVVVVVGVDDEYVFVNDPSNYSTGPIWSCASRDGPQIDAGRSSRCLAAFTGRSGRLCVIARL